VEWYHVCWPRLTAKRVEPVVSISWASCYTIGDCLITLSVIYYTIGYNVITLSAAITLSVIITLSVVTSVLNRYMHNKVVIEHSNGFLCKINNVLYVDFLNKVSNRKQRNNYLFRTMLQLVHLISMCLTVSGHWQVTHSSLSTFTSWQTRMRKTCTM